MGDDTISICGKIDSELDAVGSTETERRKELDFEDKDGTLDLVGEGKPLTGILVELAGETGPPLDSLREGDWLSELINERDLVVVAIIRESSLLLDPVGERDTLAVTITKGAEEVVSVIDTLGETGALSVLGMEGDGQFE